ncbi:hypothetical protein RND71_029345 [Anisodus tanguticus]|uniref:Uncharacterized protein n=1 Tax=Anisodus tanguticus TaxID=243964 RepID=A0AAE1V046_9SOLA|nr:hypothetical protein RND71_029345 [Anisodus tanguticus]
MALTVKGYTLPKCSFSRPEQNFLYFSPFSSFNEQNNSNVSLMKFLLYSEQRGKKPFASEVTQTDISYKTLYIDSQKKYEYIIGNMKNVVAFSNVMRVADAEINLSEGTAQDAPPLNAEPSPMKKNNSQGACSSLWK